MRLRRSAVVLQVGIETSAPQHVLGRSIGRTGTAALSTLCTVLILLFAIAVLGDFGVRAWVEDGRFDRVALHVAPLVVVYATGGVILEKAGRNTLCRPLYIAAAILFMSVLELLALDGRELAYVGMSMQRFQAADHQNPLLIDTLIAMTINGIATYGVARAIEQRGSALMQSAAKLLFMLSPFLMLQPIGWLSKSGDYALAFDWLYLATAVTITILSHARQRKSFYYAGLLNTGIGLYVLADHREWFDQQAWSIAVITAGLAALVGGFWLHRREKRASLTSDLSRLTNAGPKTCV
jgi:hypothetical protein